MSPFISQNNHGLFVRKSRNDVLRAHITAKSGSPRDQRVTRIAATRHTHSRGIYNISHPYNCVINKVSQPHHECVESLPLNLSFVCICRQRYHRDSTGIVCNQLAIKPWFSLVQKKKIDRQLKKTKAWVGQVGLETILPRRSPCRIYLAF